MVTYVATKHDSNLQIMDFCIEQFHRFSLNWVSNFQPIYFLAVSLKFVEFVTILLQWQTSPAEMLCLVSNKRQALVPTSGENKKWGKEVATHYHKFYNSSQAGSDCLQ